MVFHLWNGQKDPDMKNCPYCHSISDFHFQIAPRRFNRCPRCDLVYHATVTSYDEVLCAYRKSYFNRHSEDQMQGSRAELFDYILNLIEANQDIGTLMDVGTGCGLFLLAAQRRGWNAKGIDPSVRSVQVARDNLGLEVSAGTLQDYRENSEFDVITFINVLDHSALPWLEINCARRLLRAGGLIYLRFPNGYIHSQIYRRADKFGLSDLLRKFLVFHIYSFTPRHIMRLLHDHGFVQTTVLNSPPSEGDPHKLFRGPISATYMKRLIYLIAKCTEKISRRQLFLGTSLEVTAIKPY